MCVCVWGWGGVKVAPEISRLLGVTEPKFQGIVPIFCDKLFNATTSTVTKQVGSVVKCKMVTDKPEVPRSQSQYKIKGQR